MVTFRSGASWGPAPSAASAFGVDVPISHPPTRSEGQSAGTNWAGLPDGPSWDVVTQEGGWAG